MLGAFMCLYGTGGGFYKLGRTQLSVWDSCSREFELLAQAADDLMCHPCRARLYNNFRLSLKFPSLLRRQIKNLLR